MRDELYTELDDGREVIVNYELQNGEPMVWSYANGDPGHPGTGDEIEILSISLYDGTEVYDELDPDEIERIETKCYEDCD